MKTLSPAESSVVETTSDSRVSTGDRRLRALLVGIGLLATAAIATQVVVSAFAFGQSALGYGDSLVLTYLVGGTLATLSYVVLALAYLRYRRVEIHVPRRLLTLRETGWVLGGVVVSFAAALVLSVLGGVLGAREGTNFLAAAAAENPLLVYGVFLVGTVLVIAPAEELLFRGVVQGRLRESFGPVAAIGITAVGFALTHVPSYWIGGSETLSVGVVLALVTIAAGGAILGAIYERTGNLAVVVLVHGLTNALFVLPSLVAAL